MVSKEQFVWKRLGLCASCGTAPRTNEGRFGRYCPACAEQARRKNSRATRERQEQHKADGLCIWCGQPMDRDGSYCNACAERISQKTKKIRMARAASGLCSRCGKPTDAEHITCAACREYLNGKQKEGRKRNENM